MAKIVQCFALCDPNNPDSRCKRSILTDDFCKIHSMSKQNIKFDEYFKKHINLDYYKDNIKDIIKCQSIIRRFLVKNRLECVNDTDIVTLEKIKSKYFVSVKFGSSKNNKYAFDVRSLKNFLDSKNKYHPYTHQLMTEGDIKALQDALKKFNKNKVSLDFEKPKLTKQQHIQALATKFAGCCNEIGYIIDTNWFMDLSLPILKKLYYLCEDIWNYRSQLTPKMKKKIVKNGKIFTIKLNEVSEITDKDYLLITIINEWLRICDEAIDDAHKGTGVMLMLTALTNYSQPCCDTYPFLYQAILA
jgi:hypothetical protein